MVTPVRLGAACLAVGDVEGRGAEGRGAVGGIEERDVWGENVAERGCAAGGAVGDIERDAGDGAVAVLSEGA